MSQITVQIELPISVKKKAKWFLACCPPLDVHAQGESREKAIDNLKETLELFLVSCMERGVLDDVLIESGFSVSKGEIKPSKQVKIPKENYVNIPLYLLSNNSTLTRCHA